MLIYLGVSLITLIILFATSLCLIKLAQIAGKPLYLSGLWQHIAVAFVFWVWLASMASLFIPLHEYLFWVFGALGLSYLALHAAAVKTVLQQITKFDWWLYMTLFGFTGWIGASGILHYDAALYHVQAIQWIQSYSVVPGLGNLHGRFGFNSLFFPVSAVFSCKFDLFDKSILVFPLNGLLFFGFVADRLKQAKLAIEDKLLATVAYHLVIVLLLGMYSWNFLGSTFTDMVVCIFTIMTIELFARENTPKQAPHWLLALLVFALITIKLSSALLILFVLASPLWWSSTAVKKWHLLLPTVTLGLLVAMPFVVRNVYTSGYLLFPFPAVDWFEVDWKMPLSAVTQEKTWISSWAKMQVYEFDAVAAMSLREWVPVWFQNQHGVNRILLISSILYFILSMWRFKREKHQGIIAIIVAANLLFWFVNAPDLRFAHGLFFFCTATAIYQLSKLLEARLRYKHLAIFLSILALMPLSIWGMRALGTANGYLAEPSRVFFPAKFEIESAALPTTTYTTNFSYQVPLVDDRCYDHPLPCTPYPNPKLQLRGSSLQEGFRIAEQ